MAHSTNIRKVTIWLSNDTVARLDYLKILLFAGSRGHVVDRIVSEYDVTSGKARSK
ncbi:MAG: hypothetical protein WA719_02275 [Thermoplasmata archaeon]